MKKILISFCFTLFLLSISNISIKAKSVDTEFYQELEYSQESIYRDITFTNVIANTKTIKPVGNVAGLGSSGPIDPNTWYGQQINMVDIPRHQNVDVISWSIQGDSQWNLATVIAMAENFEQLNPGWRVIAGINGDFYDWHTTYDYPNSGTGSEVIRGNTIRAITSRCAVGIKNDDSNNQLVYGAAGTLVKSAMPYLEILDENNNIEKRILVDVLNDTLSDNQTGVYFGRFNIEYLYDENNQHIPNQYGENTIKARHYEAPRLSTNGTTFLVENATKVIQQMNQNSYYGIGSITEIITDKTVDDNSFAVATTDDEVLNALAVGKTIRVQFALLNQFEGINNVMGTDKVLINNGVPASYYDSEDYYTTRAPRSIIACKADGTIGLVTIDGRQASKDYYGANQQEMNEILLAYDYTNAYLLDGGGSSTLIVRENDKFVVKNSPSDGSARSVGNAILVVAKDPDFEVKSITSTTNSISIDLDMSKVDENKLKNIYCTLNGKTLTFNEGKVVFERLTKNTEYEYYITYDYESDENLESPYRGIIHTAKSDVVLNSVNAMFDKEYVYLYPSMTDEDTAVSLMYFSVNGKSYICHEPVVQIRRSVFTSDTFEYSLIYQYDINDYKGQQTITKNGTIDIIDLEIEVCPDADKKGCAKNGAILSIVLLTSFALIPFIVKRKD